MQTQKSYLILFISIIVSACGNQTTKRIDNKDTLVIDTRTTDSLKHDRKVERPDKSEIINSTFSTDNLLGIWTSDPKGHHADFQLTPSSFHIVDYVGYGNMPYILKDDKITIYYPDFKETGLIKKAANDTLIIYWASGAYTAYTRWTN